MKIYIATEVEGNYKKILPQFNQDLFLALAPPGMKLNLLRFDGSKKGDTVHIAMQPLGMKILEQEWVSEITEDNENNTEAWFVDEGKILPPFLAKWKHRHLVQKKSENRSIIVDDIQFSTPFRLLDFLMYPIMYAQFYYRKPIYKRFFGK